MRATNVLLGQLLCLTLVSVLISTPVSAQALRPGRSVTVTSVDGKVLAGRLVAGDSTTITIDRPESSLTLDRASIARLSYRSHRSGLPRFLGTVGGALSGLFLGALASGLCESSDCDNAFVVGGLAGGAVGGLFFTNLGSSIGAVAPRWDDISPRTPVSAFIQPAVAPAPCARNQEWSAASGRISTGGYTARAMMTFFCEPEMRSGLELGYLTRPFAEHRQGGSISGYGNRSWYLGLVNERSIGRYVLDPRLVTSVEWHSWTERNTWSGPGYGGEPRTDAHTYSSSGPGLGLGLSMGFNPSPHLSIRGEAREHLSPVGTFATWSVGGQWRP